MVDRRRKSVSRSHDSFSEGPREPVRQPVDERKSSPLHQQQQQAGGCRFEMQKCETQQQPHSTFRRPTSLPPQQRQGRRRPLNPRRRRRRRPISVAQWWCWWWMRRLLCFSSLSSGIRGYTSGLLFLLGWSLRGVDGFANYMLTRTGCWLDFMDASEVIMNHPVALPDTSTSMFALQFVVNNNNNVAQPPHTQPVPWKDWSILRHDSPDEETTTWTWKLGLQPLTRQAEREDYQFVLDVRTVRLDDHGRPILEEDDEEESSGDEVPPPPPRASWIGGACEDNRRVAGRPDETMTLQVVVDDPNNNKNNLALAIFGAWASGHEQVKVVQPYYLLLPKEDSTTTTSDESTSTTATTAAATEPNFDSEETIDSGTFSTRDNTSSSSSSTPKTLSTPPRDDDASKDDARRTVDPQRELDAKIQLDLRQHLADLEAKKKAKAAGAAAAAPTNHLSHDGHHHANKKHVSSAHHHKKTHKHAAAEDDFPLVTWWDGAYLKGLAVLIVGMSITIIACPPLSRRNKGRRDL